VQAKVLLLQDVDPAGKEYLEQNGCECILAAHREGNEMIEEIRKINPEAFLVRVDGVTREMMEAAPALKVIAKHGVGVENVDIKAASEKGIRVVNVPGGNYLSVAEHAAFLMMACAKRYKETERLFGEDGFQARYELPRALELGGRTLGILGCGHIGRALARIASAGLDMKVRGWSRSLPAGIVTEEGIEGASSREEVIRAADFLVLCLPSTAETRHSIGMKELNMMKKTAFLINVARGDIVVEQDLIRALEEKQIAGAGLDVFDPEPPDPRNPLLHREDVVATPHFAAFTGEAMVRMSLQAAQQIVEVLQGKKPQHPVN
jgi:D-3-phosphoglycerate dehydrogenase